MRGRKIGLDIREKALAMRTINSRAYVARELGIPTSTIQNWEIEAAKDEEKNTKLVEIREKKRQEFIDLAWQGIEEGTKQLVELINSGELKPGELNTIVGTLFDKRALANKEPTQIVDGELSIKKFEDFT